MMTKCRRSLPSATVNRRSQTVTSDSYCTLLLDAIPHNLFLKDRASVYLACNQNFARMLGLTPQQIIGRTDLELFPEHLASKYRSDDQRKAHQPRQYLAGIGKEDGRVRQPCQPRAYPGFWGDACFAHALLLAATGAVRN